MDRQYNSIQKDLSLFDNKAKKDNIMDALAEKLLDVLDLEVLDFHNDPVKTVHINQIRSQKQLLKFKKPLQITIKKEYDTFNVSQHEISIEVLDLSFRMAMKKFQEELYYQYKNTKSNNKELTAFFNQYL